MLIQLKGGHVVDPVQGLDGPADIYFENGRIIADPNRPADQVIDVSGKIVMAGAIDIHTHVAGGNVTMSRLLLPELHISEIAAPAAQPFATAKWSTWETGRLYAEMGFTTVIEPALPPTHALATHIELTDLPVVDRGALTVIGNDDHLLSLMRAGESRTAIRDAVAQTLSASRGLGLKCINAGGAAAFKQNIRTFNLDDTVPHYGVSTRRIMTTLITAQQDIGIPHPLHVHCNNLGVPGAPETIAATISAVEGRPVHFAHIQFYAYGDDGKGMATSGAEAICKLLADNPNVTVDVGQVMFGPTVTISLDVQKQYAGHTHAKPRKWSLTDGDAEGGGVVPIQYSTKSWMNQLQWAIGMELFLLSPDPWRVLMTTDHPNGGPFTTYPKILHLLMDAEERQAWVNAMPEITKSRTGLGSISREYSLREVAIMTRAAPAKLLGLTDKGHLQPGAVADIAVYDNLADKTAMFTSAHLVFKDGRKVVENGRTLGWFSGHTHILQPATDPTMAGRIDRYLTDRYGVGSSYFAVTDAAFGERPVFEVEPCLI